MAAREDYVARIEATDWEGLRGLWEQILRGDTPGWEPGRAFEYLVIRAFQLGGAGVRWPYEVRDRDDEEVIEEIDGAVHWGGMHCLVQAKDREQRLNIEPIAKLRNQLLRRPAGALGMVFSRSSFTNPALYLAQFNAPHAILLWEGGEVEYAIQTGDACRMLERKYLALVEYGIPDYYAGTPE